MVCKGMRNVPGNNSVEIASNVSGCVALFVRSKDVDLILSNVVRPRESGVRKKSLIHPMLEDKLARVILRPQTVRFKLYELEVGIYRINVELVIFNALPVKGADITQRKSVTRAEILLQRYVGLDGVRVSQVW